MASVLVVGELNPDIIVAGVPAESGCLRFGQAEDIVDATTITLGASAAITAAAVARAGASASLCAVVGDDHFGTACREWAKALGVDTSHVRVVEGGITGSSVILVAPDGDRHILTNPGTMRDLEVDDIEETALAWHDHLHVSSFFMHDRARADLHVRMTRAREMGVTVSLDTNDDPQREWSGGAQEALAQADVLFVNETEACGLAGMSDEVDAARALLGRVHVGTAMGPAVVLKRGQRGATAFLPDRRITVAAPRVDVVDTVGAGDTLAGTVIASLLAGRTWEDALAAGVAAGSLSTCGVGGTGGQADAPEVAEVARGLEVTTTREVHQ